MTQAKPATPAGAHPTLFGAAATDAGQPSPQRISVLASLDSQPVPLPGKRRRPLQRVLLALVGLGLVVAVAWESLPFLLPQRAQTRPAAVATAPESGKPAASAPVEAQATTAPASIERIPAEESVTGLAAPATPGTPSTPSADASTPAGNAPVAEAASNGKSLLANLAAPADESTEAPAKKPSASKHGTAPARTKNAPSHVATNDADVILLEALVAANPRAKASPTPDKKP